MTIATAPYCPKCHVKKMYRDGDSWACLSCGKREPLSAQPAALLTERNGHEAAPPVATPASPALGFDATVGGLIAHLEKQRATAQAQIDAAQQTVSQTTQQIKALQRALGHEILNPAENFGGRLDLPRTEYLRLDVLAVCSVEAVAVLPGWWHSRGAQLETYVAREIGLPILDAETLEPLFAPVEVPQ